MDISGGSLSFKSVMDNGQMDGAIEETLRRVEGLTNATVRGGEQMDGAFKKTASQMLQALNALDAATVEHQNKISELEAKYQELGEKASVAKSQGRDEELRAIEDEMSAIRGEIRMREDLLEEIGKCSDELFVESLALAEQAEAADKNGEAHTSMRARIRELREELVEMEMAGKRGTEEYRALQEEVGRLTDAWGDATAQANIMAHDQRGMQGIISGLSGVSGAFSAAQGAVSLFAGENENLQKIMLKVQSLMAITVGLQQVEQTLNKDSAFQLVTLAGVKEWWNKVLAESGIRTTAETAATIANTAAKEANATASGAQAAGEAVATGAIVTETGAATAGTVANFTLAGAFRAVGVAIKSIPVFGWIAAAIGAIVGVVGHFVSKANEAKKAAKEFGQSLAESAYKPIGNIELLSTKWNALGDDLDAKKKFIEDNAKAFDELGVAINGVTDAENLLVANKDAFINAQIEKAKAMVYIKQAEENIKALIELENEYNAMPDTKTVYYSQGMYGGVGSYETHNDAKDKKKAEMDELRKTIEDGYTNAANAERNGLLMLQKVGVQATGQYASGTLGAIEQAIALKQAALKNLTNNDDYKKALAEIQDLQKQANAITGTVTTSGGGSSSSSDPFLEKLNKYRTEYARFQKWMNSGDKILVQSANQEFAGLLKEGATFIEYLKNQRDALLSIDAENRTKTQNKKLRQLNDAIAEETKKTVLDAFNNELSASLSNAKTAVEMLNTIKKMREELANDGTDVDNAKKETLDDAEIRANEKAKSELESLMTEFASFTEKKRQMEEQLAYDLEILDKKRASATSEAEIAEIDRVIAARKKAFEDESKSPEQQKYDALLEQYQNFEQKKQAIIDDFDAKRKIAEQNNNQALVEELNKAQAKALSSLALEDIQANPDWELLFGNLDEVSTRKLQELVDKIDGMTAYLGVEFDPKDLETLKDKVNGIKDEILQRNPFKALQNAVKDYGKAADDEAKKKTLSKMFEATSSSIGLISGAFDSVVDGINKLGVNMDEQTGQVMNDISGMLSGASDLAMGIATGNPLQIIQGSISLVTNAIDLFNSHDREADRRIEKHKEAIKSLQSQYEQLSWEVDKALGSSYYKSQRDAIKNLEEQQRRLQAIKREEQGKKKSDNDAIRDYQDQIDELSRNISDLYDEIADDILQTTAKDFADELGDSLVEAFAAGEDAANAFETTVNDVMKNAIVNQLKKNFLESQLQGALDQLQNSLGTFDSSGNFTFNGLTDEEIAAFKERVKGIADTYNQALGIYSDLFKDMNLGGTEADTSLSGAVKGVSEETAGMIAGQMNAIRINQLEATQVLRNSLLVLNQIATNTAYCQYLSKIDRVISLMEAGDGNSLRSQGLS